MLLAREQNLLINIHLFMKFIKIDGIYRMLRDSLRACSSAIREVTLELQCLCLPLPTATTCVSFCS